MYGDFWERSPQRFNNPTFLSGRMTTLLSGSFMFSPLARQNVQAPLFRSSSLSSVAAANPQALRRQAESIQKKKGIYVESDIDVFRRQRRMQRNIITQVPKEYRENIKMFPKLRMEKYDGHYHNRQAFIRGLPQKTYAPEYSKMRQSSLPIIKS